MKTNFLKEYGVWEYVLFLAGLALLSKLVYSFMIDTIESTLINFIALVVSVLMMAAPATIVKAAKEKAEAFKNRTPK